MLFVRTGTAQRDILVDHEGVSASSLSPHNRID